MNADGMQTISASISVYQRLRIQRYELFNFPHKGIFESKGLEFLAY